MRAFIALAAAAILIGTGQSSWAQSSGELRVAQAAADCPPGKVTCKDWCRRYNAESKNCLTGHPNSCDKKVGGERACVDDKPRVIGSTCSANNAECTAFCSTTEGKAQGKACPNACAERMRNCLQTGTYVWRNRPNATGLEKK
jgi:hypothetical protein